MQQARLLTALTLAIIPPNLNTLEKNRYCFDETDFGKMLRLRGGKTEIDADDHEEKRRSKMSLRANKISRTERRHEKRERRKDRIAMIASQNLAAKEGAKLLQIKKLERSAPSLDRSETIIFDKGRGNKMIPRRQHEEESGLEWDEAKALAEKVGDGVADWRILQAAVKRREPSAAVQPDTEAYGGGDGGRSLDKGRHAGRVRDPRKG
jgi:hypothetical protein